MNVSNIGSRAKPRIITRVSHALIQSSHRATSVTCSSSSSSSSSTGVVSARALSAQTVAPMSSKASSPPPSSSSTSTSTKSSEPPPPQSSSPEDVKNSSADPHQNHQENNIEKEKPTSVSTWLWRTIYLTVGAAGTGLAAQYAIDPTPVRQAGQAMYDTVNARLRYFTEPSREKLLPDPPTPPGGYGPGVLPPRTLVIDLENTLVHSSYSRATGWRIAKRPGAEAFLAYMASFYEIVVFTSNLYTYADPILGRLDPNGYVQHRLYRSETHFMNGVHVKDLSCLNRPLDRTIVVDKDPKSVQLHPENAIIIPKWTGDPSDTALLDLIPILEGVVKEDVQDVRDVMRNLQGKSVPDALTEYRATAAERAQKAKAATSISVFGHVPDAPPPPPLPQSGTEKNVEASPDDIDGEAEASKGSVWGSLSGRSKLFSSKSMSASDAK